MNNQDFVEYDFDEYTYHFLSLFDSKNGCEPSVLLDDVSN